MTLAVVSRGGEAVSPAPVIRLATPSDFPRLVEMGCRFLAETGYGGMIARNRDEMEKLLAKIQVAVLDCDGLLTGMLGYIVYPHPMSGETVGGEVMWWVEPEYRGHGQELLRWVEEEVKQQGAVIMQMIAPNQRVGKLYQRLGYQEVETTFQRRLN